MHDLYYQYSGKDEYKKDAEKIEVIVPYVSSGGLPNQAYQILVRPNVNLMMPLKQL